MKPSYFYIDRKFTLYPLNGFEKARKMYLHAPILGQVDALDLLRYFCLNRGEIYRKSRLSNGF